jgi:hypothetical protein
LTVLVAGDTCVHPDFRRKGLSVLMGIGAIKTFSSDYSLFLNMTTTAPSLPGYLKLGFQPMTRKAYLSQYTFPGLTRYLWTYKKQSRIKNSKTSLGTFGPVIVSEQAKPEAMTRICTYEKISTPCFRLLRDEAFFKWRFLNPFKTYRFYYFSRNSELAGYLITGFSPNARRGYILDFADIDGESVIHLLKHMIQNKDFDILSLYHFSMEDTRRTKIQDLNFKATGFVRSLERKKTGELPVLVRPLVRSPCESDWKIAGLDVRNIKNWQMNEIFSDSV